MRSGDYTVAPSFQLLPSPLWPGVVVHFEIESIDQIDFFKLFVSMGLCVKKQLRNNCTKNVDINAKGREFSDL